MNNLIHESVVKLAETFQLPERVLNVDDLPWVPFDQGADSNCFFKPLRFDLATGTWIYLFRIKSNQVLTRHRHTGGNVIGFNLEGEWSYAGRDWVARPGTFIFEPPGDIHTLMTGDQETITLFILSGALQYFDESNQIVGQDDIYSILHKYREYCRLSGLEVREDLIY